MDAWKTVLCSRLIFRGELLVVGGVVWEMDCLWVLQVRRSEDLRLSLHQNFTKAGRRRICMCIYILCFPFQPHKVFFHLHNSPKSKTTVFSPTVKTEITIVWLPGFLPRYMSKSKLQRLLLPGHLTSLVVNQPSQLGRVGRLDDLSGNFWRKNWGPKKPKKCVSWFRSHLEKGTRNLDFNPSQGHARGHVFFFL